jgi:CheY-like chemotaxis protein
MDLERKQILWVDDEIDLLRPHMIFLGERGYDVTPVTNGEDAISLVKRRAFDIILLDEMMTGRDGLSTLATIRDIDPALPVIMITKVEDERLMDEAIGKRFDDFLTKPVNPSQILSACKRILDARQIRHERAGRDYTTESQEIQALLDTPLHWRDWVDLHIRLAEWDLEISRLDDPTLKQMHADQRRECNIEFGRYIERTYHRWMKGEDAPLLSVDILDEFVVPLLVQGQRVVFIVIDCMRLDHYLSIEPLLSELYSIRRSYYYSILPTATPFARNAIFGGLFPDRLSDLYPDLYQLGRDDEQSLNRYEHQLLERQLSERGLGSGIESRYMKIFDVAEGRNLVRRVGSFRTVPLVALVFNFLDMLAHGRSESEILQEITPDVAAFRALTTAWFSHSSLLEVLRKIAQTDTTVIITSDHGSVLCTHATLVYGNRETSTNLRYKYGRNLRCDPKHALLITSPEDYRLPSIGLGGNFIIAKGEYYFVYPTHFHEYQRQYRDSFQHGGISLEEMILPVAIMRPK